MPNKVSDLPIYKKTYELMKYVNITTTNIPKPYTHLLIALNTSFESVVANISRIKYSTDPIERYETCKVINTELSVIAFKLTFLYEIKAFNNQGYANCIKYIAEVGKEVEQWLKYLLHITKTNHSSASTTTVIDSK